VAVIARPGALAEVGLIQAAVAEVLEQVVGDRLPLSVGHRRC
jgi:hypothetical protein